MTQRQFSEATSSEKAKDVMRRDMPLLTCLHLPKYVMSFYLDKRRMTHGIARMIPLHLRLHFSKLI
jgi:hypothetical protein